MDRNAIISLVDRQLKHFWNFEITELFCLAVDRALGRFEQNFSAKTEQRVSDGGSLQLNPYHSVQWSIFLYYLSNELGKTVRREDAAMVYYLNKIMNGVDWYFEIELPKHFWAEHPLKCVLGRACYGDYFFVYQGVTVGGNYSSGGVLCYPQIGNSVIMYSDSKVLGKSKVGNNVIISANTYIKNETIPDNCIVFGQSPNLIFKSGYEKYIREIRNRIWI